ncbi:MAG: hypothetical protein ACRBCJ_11730 [Hyphomicrobiaceae bacterium]
MQAITRKHEAELPFEHGDVVEEIILSGPNYFSILSEAIDDRTKLYVGRVQPTKAPDEGCVSWHCNGEIQFSPAAKFKKTQ